MFAALFAACTVVKAEGKTNIQYIYIQSNIDNISDFAAVNGQELPEPNFSIVGAKPAEAVDALYIDTSQKSGWYRDSIYRCVDGEKFENGHTYSLDLTVGIKPEYTDTYKFVYVQGWTGGNTYFAQMDGGYIGCDLSGDYSAAMNKSFPVTPAETDPPELTVSSKEFDLTVGEKFSAGFSAYGYKPFEWSITGTLPDGLTFNETTGHISGIAAKSGDYSFKIGAKNANGYDEASVTMHVKGDDEYVYELYLEGDFIVSELNNRT